MASAIKHAQRSHRNYSDNRYIFSKFQQYSAKVKHVKDERRAVKRATFLDRMKSLFGRKPRKES